MVIFIVVSAMLGTIFTCATIYLLATYTGNKYASKGDWYGLVAVFVLAVCFWYGFSVVLENYRVGVLLV